MRSAKQFLFGSLGAALAVSGLSALQATPAQAASTGLVINEVYGGGGNNGAVYTNDYIELFNPTDTPISLDGKSLQYRAASATVAAPGSSGVFAFPAGQVVPAHGYYLVQAAAGNTAVAPLPMAPDAVVPGTNLNLSGTGGQIYLASVATALPPVTNAAAPWTFATEVIDFLGWGGSTVTYEGTDKAPATANATSSSRSAAHTDTDNNAVDFTTGAPSPQNSSVIESGEPTPLAVTNPGDKTFTQNQAIAPLQLQASGGTGPYEWAVTTGTLPNGLTLSPGGLLEGTPDTVTGSPVPITVTVTDAEDETATASFTIAVQAPLAVTPIAEIQGTGARSPFAPETGNGQGAEVKATEGVVTAVYYTGGFNGMYIQTPGVDTPDASDGLFVYGGTTNANIPAGIQVGDSVRVTGRIAEFYNLTQIVPGAGGVSVLGTSLGTVTSRAFTYPTTDEEREKYEGELVDPQGTFTVSNVYSTNDFGEITLASGEGPLKQPSEFADASDPDALQAVRNENARRAVALDDGSTTRYLSSQATKAQPLPWLTGSDGNAVAAPPRVGAGVEFQSDVVFDWRNDIRKFQPQSQVTTNGASVATFEDTRAADATPADVLTMTPGRTGDLKIATFNVLNYFNTTGEAYSAAGPLQEPPLDTFCTYYTDRGDPGPPSVNGARIGNNSCGVRLLDDPTTPDKDESKDNDGRGPRGAATAASLARQEAKLVHTINALGADVIGLEEVENSIKLPGETNRDDAVARLVDILNAAPGRTPGPM